MAERSSLLSRLHNILGPVAGVKGDAHLQFWIVFSPGSMPRVRPCIIENIFSLRVSFGVHWHDANHFTFSFDRHVKRLPTRFLASTAAFLKSVEKALLNEGIVWS